MAEDKPLSTLPLPAANPPFPTRKKTGRPSTYDDEIVAEICARVADGESLTAICKQEWSPGFRTVFDWLAKYPDFNKRFYEARAIGLERMAQELIEIADDGSNDWMESNHPDNPGYRVNGEHVNRSRLRVDTRKWFLAKLAPKIYGERVQHDVNVNVELSEGLKKARARLSNAVVDVVADAVEYQPAAEEDGDDE